ncbi:MAG TPA: hypothetical protein VF177_09595 [Anaerolineae bacterium]
MEAEMVMMSARLLVAVLGVFIVVGTLISAVKTFVLPRGINVLIVQIVFTVVGFFFRLRIRKASTFEERDRIFALYAPLTLLLLPVVLLSLILIGYTCLFWALETSPLTEAFRLSGSSLLTLGYATGDTMPHKILEFSEAMIGLIMVALLIAYLPSMYSSFSRRETAVALWEARAGTPPSVVEMVARSHRTGELDRLREVWLSWQTWFAEVEESHTSLAPLNMFRSPQPDRSWVTAAGNVLDSAAFILAAVDVPPEPQAAFCIRAGYLALRQICSFFNIPYDPDPSPDDPISVSRVEFDEVYDQLAAQGVPLKPDRDQGWQDFVGWRVNYDTALIALAAFTMAPYAPWSSDRSTVRLRQRVLR